VNPHIFREYDVRGVFGSDLDPRMAADLGRAFGSHARANLGAATIVVGRDNRDHSLILAQSLVEGLRRSGCDVIDIGLTVSPILYYSCLLYETGAGVMVTGSHNPPEYNGFKMVLGQSTIYGPEIQQIRRIIEQGDYMQGCGSVENRDPHPAYISMIRNKIQLGPRPLQAVVDCGNGTASVIAPVLLRELGCRVHELYCRSDPDFPHHHPDPAKSENLVDLRAEVLARGADLGVAYDGDADRIGVVDNQGRILWGDELMVLFWRELLPRYPGTPAVIEVKCSRALVDEVERLGGKPIFYKSGHSLIKAKMRELGAVFAGEMSGHMFFADEYYGFDDALYATARLLRMLSHARETLSEMVATIPRYYSTAETRIDCSDEEKWQAVERIREHFSQQYDVVSVDGARVLFDDGWGLIRASNTSPQLVARCEGESPEALRRICREIKEAVMRFSPVQDFAWEE